MIKLLIILLIVGSFGCSSLTRTEKITIKGSDTMYELLEILSAVYMKNNPNVSIYVTGGGTEIGFHALETGIADICMASRNFNPDEVKILAEKYQSIGISNLIAKDAISIYLNRDNDISNLNLDELKSIFLCGTKNWSEIEGSGTSIIPIRRKTTSGTYHYFKSHVLDGQDFCDSVISFNSHDEMIKFIEENPNSIGFGGIGNHGNTKLAKINGIEPTPDNVRNDKYILTRYLQLYTINKPNGIIKNFIDWVQSSEGQKIIRNLGYISFR